MEKKKKTNENVDVDIVRLMLPSKEELYEAYMPYLKSGGLFVPTKKDYSLGDEVIILLKLMDEPMKISVEGSVAWVTPVGAQGNRMAGIGVEFKGDNAVEVRSKIEAYLGGLLQAEDTTRTM